MRRYPLGDGRSLVGTSVRPGTPRPGARPVVLVPGGGQTRRSWRATQRLLADAGWASLALDLPGHGDSDRRPDGHYTPDTIGADLAAAIGERAEPVHLVGASLGGIAGILAVVDHGLPAASLVLVDITPEFDRHGGERIATFLRAGVDGYASVAEAARAVAGHLPHRGGPRAEQLRHNLRRGDDGRWYWHWDPAMVSDENLARAFRPRLLEAARRLTLPTMLVRGLRSDVVTDDAVARFRHLLPHAAVADVRDAHHMVTGDDNIAFGRALTGFLAAQDLAAPD